MDSLQSSSNQQATNQSHQSHTMSVSQNAHMSSTDTFSHQQANHNGSAGIDVLSSVVTNFSSNQQQQQPLDQSYIRDHRAMSYDASMGGNVSSATQSNSTMQRAESADEDNSWLGFTNEQIKDMHSLPHFTTAKPFACNQCDTTFSRLYNLRAHMYVHSKQRPFQCSLCTQSFSRMHDLKRHKKLHNGARPHQCKHCHRTFARLDALTRHLRVNGNGGPCAGISGRRVPVVLGNNPNTTLMGPDGRPIDPFQPMIPQLQVTVASMSSTTAKPTQNEVKPIEISSPNQHANLNSQPQTLNTLQAPNAQLHRPAAQDAIPSQQFQHGMPGQPLHENQTQMSLVRSLPSISNITSQISPSDYSLVPIKSFLIQTPQDINMTDRAPSPVRHEPYKTSSSDTIQTSHTTLPAPTVQHHQQSHYIHLHPYTNDTTPQQSKQTPDTTAHIISTLQNELSLLKKENTNLHHRIREIETRESQRIHAIKGQIRGLVHGQSQAYPSGTNQQ